MIDTKLRAVTTIPVVGAKGFALFHSPFSVLDNVVAVDAGLHFVGINNDS